MANKTKLLRNALSDLSGGHNHSGTSMHIGPALVVYVLPTPAAHWISAIECIKVYNP